MAVKVWTVVVNAGVYGGTRGVVRSVHRTRKEAMIEVEKMGTSHSDYVFGGNAPPFPSVQGPFEVKP